MEERKEYFEPQVLKIDDNYEAPLSDNDLIDEEYDECHNIKPVEVVADTVSVRPISSKKYSNTYNNNNNNNDTTSQSNLPRPKSAFKQSFDYEESLNASSSNNNESSKAAERAVKDGDEEKKEKKRSKTRDKSARKHRSSSRNGKRSESRSSKNDLERDNSSSRIATGDTGYESLSSLSLSSSLNSSTQFKNLDSINNLKERLNQHQPIIISSSSSSSSNNLLNSSSFGLSTGVKPASQQTLNTTFKNLKSNLTPLSGIKLNNQKS